MNKTKTKHKKNLNISKHKAYSDNAENNTFHGGVVILLHVPRAASVGDFGSFFLLDLGS